MLQTHSTTEQCEPSTVDTWPDVDQRLRDGQLPYTRVPNVIFDEAGPASTTFAEERQLFLPIR